MSREVIFIGLPGPYHNYGGLSADNVASGSNRHTESNPKEAALQAIELAQLVASFGTRVAFLPPLMRPHASSLGNINVSELVKNDPAKLERIYSSSAMWTANAATVAPSVDTLDNKLHLTTANLHTKEHRRIEAEDTHRILKAIFEPDAIVHSPLPASEGMRDEGAANHTRLATSHDAKGLHLFVYGATGSKDDPEWARQTLKASEQVAVNHHLARERTLFIRQNPSVIKQGVFHNDVIAVGHLGTLLYHEEAYGGAGDIAAIQAAYNKLPGNPELTFVPVYSSELSVDEAVKTYLFNSQLITTQKGDVVIIAPSEVEENPRARAVVARILADKNNSINTAKFVNLKQSMRNGGGPACLRLRVVMSDEQIKNIASRVNVFSEEWLISELKKWINSFYPEQIRASDLADVKLINNTKAALTELSTIMKLPILP